MNACSDCAGRAALVQHAALQDSIAKMQYDLIDMAL
jgi:hypothetical protein